MAVLVALLLAAALAACVPLLLAYIRFRRLELAIPGPPSLPVLGSVLCGVGLNKDTVLATFLRLWDYHYPLWRVSAFGVLGVYASDPDHLQVLLTRKDLVNKDRFVYKFFDTVGRGILAMNGAEWREHRRAFQPAFHQTVLDRYSAVFSAEALGFVRRVRPGEAQAVADNLQSLMARAFLRTGVASGDLSEEEMERLLPDIKALVNAVSQSFCLRIVQPWLWPDWCFFGLTATGREIRRLSAKLDAFSRGLIAKGRDEQRNKSQDGGAGPDAPVTPAAKYRSLVEVLMEPGERLSLSDDEILDEYKTFMGAAIDSSVATLGWALKALSLEQGVQQRLLREVEDVLGEDGAAAGHITAEDLDRLEYTERVLKETLRLLPTAPLIVREVRQQTEFCGYTLPAGASLVGNILGAHRHPGHWPDPLRFDPDRFLPENSEGRHPYAYLPFSAGPRNCIGGRYAMMVMKTLLATLVPHYRIDPVDDGYKEPSSLPMALGITSRMVGGVRVVFTPRAGCDALC